MGLIKCIDCGAMVSDRAKACPHCGGPIDDVIKMSRMPQQAAQQPQLQQPVPRSQQASQQPQLQQPVPLPQQAAQQPQLQQPVPPPQQAAQQPQLQQPVPPPQQVAQQQWSQQATKPRVKVSRLSHKSHKPVEPKQPLPQEQKQQETQQQAKDSVGDLTKKCVKCHCDINVKFKFCNYCGAEQPSTYSAASKTAALHIFDSPQKEDKPDSPPIEDKPKDEKLVNDNKSVEENETMPSSAEETQSSKSDIKMHYIFIIAAIFFGTLLIAETFSLCSNNKGKNESSELSESKSDSGVIKSSNNIYLEEELTYMKLNDVWDVERIKNEDNLNLCEAIINGDVDWFMKLAETYNTLPKSLRNGYIQTIYNFIAQNPNLKESAPVIFKNSIYKNTLNLAEISNEFRKLVIEADSIAKSVEPDIAKTEIKAPPKPSPLSVSKPSLSSSSHSSRKHSSKKHSSKK